MKKSSLLATITKHLRLAPMIVGTFILVWAPMAEASIGTDEVDDFVKWPLYQNCGEAGANIDITTTAGLTITGTSTFMRGDPMTTTYPAVYDDAAFAAAMEAFIKKATPNGPWAKISNIGARLVSEGKAKNVNPMMIIVIGRHETNLGSDGGASARNNNSFGNKGSGPNGYRTWPSVEDSLFGSDSFILLVQQRLNKDPKAPRNYDNVKNMYEYLSVHISGQIIYPGDNTSVHDELMNVSVTVKNVTQYFDLAKQWIGEMTGLKIEGIPIRSNATPGGIGAAVAEVTPCVAEAVATAAGSGAVNPDGYSFPVEDQTKRNYGGSGPPCNKSGGCHHTGGVQGRNLAAAFDLMYGGNSVMNGKKVYAISDGTITRRKIYREVKDCYSISFKSSKDGLNYWYGHLQNPNMGLAENTPVKAGTILAEVAGPQHGPVCHGRSAGAQPGSHLHIDRGCPGYGGGGACRDISFVALMNNMWEKLPASGGGGPRPE